MNLYVLIVAVFLGLSSAGGLFLILTSAVRRVYFNLISIPKRDIIDERVLWLWDKINRDKSNSILIEKLNDVFRFLKERSVLVKVVISAAFTLSSLYVGHFFNIFGHLSFLSDFENITEYRRLEGFIYHSFTMFILLNIIFTITILNWKKKKDTSIIYSFIVYNIILMIVFKTVTIYIDYYFQGALVYLNSQWIVIVINLLFLIYFFKPILNIDDPIQCLLVSLLIIAGNIILFKFLSYKSWFSSYIVDGISNRLLVLYLVNFIYDYIMIFFFLKLRSILSKKSSFSLFIYISLILSISIFVSILTYFTYTLYMYFIQSSFPEITLSQSFQTINFFDWVWKVIQSSFTLGYYDYYFYALSNFVPLLFLVIYSLFRLITRKIKKISAGLFLFVFNLSDKRDQENTPIILINLILIFVCFLVFVGATHLTYIEFISNF